MKTKGYVILVVIVSCILWIHGAWAETKGYIDNWENSTTGHGVLGAKLTSNYEGFAAISGWASNPAGVWTVAGYFRNDGYYSCTGIDVYVPYGYGGTFDAGHKGVIARAGRIGGEFHGENTDSYGSKGVEAYGNGYGVYAQNSSTSGYGVYGYSSASSGYTYGGKFVSASTSGKGFAGYASAATGQTYGGSFGSASTSGSGIIAVAYSPTGQTYGVIGHAVSPSGYGVYSRGNMKVEGNFTATGTKAAVVKLKNGESVSLYAVEATENWFEDFGSSTLKKGKTVVKIDSTFADTVNTDTDYHVFLTPNGDCKGLYVTNKKGASFEVRELNGGKSDISFSYRIVAKRKGYEGQRLAKVKEDERTVMATIEEGDMRKGEATELASHVQ